MSRSSSSRPNRRARGLDSCRVRRFCELDTFDDAFDVAAGEDSVVGCCCQVKKIPGDWVRGVWVGTGICVPKEYGVFIGVWFCILSSMTYEIYGHD